MIFSKEKITLDYTIERCALCKKESKRKFQKGDCLFTKTTKCKLCDGMMQIEMIFGESIEK